MRRRSLFLLAPSGLALSLLRVSVLVRNTLFFREKLVSHDQCVDIEENGVRLRLTVVDTPGFGDFVNNDNRCVRIYSSCLQMHLDDDVFTSLIVCSWKPIVENIEARFDAYLEQENRVNRRSIVDNRVHACLYFIQPTGHAYV